LRVRRYVWAAGRLDELGGGWSVGRGPDVPRGVLLNVDAFHQNKFLWSGASAMSGIVGDSFGMQHGRRMSLDGLSWDPTDWKPVATELQADKTTRQTAPVGRNAVEVGSKHPGRLWHARRLADGRFQFFLPPNPLRTNSGQCRNCFFQQWKTAMTSPCLSILDRRSNRCLKRHTVRRSFGKEKEKKPSDSVSAPQVDPTSRGVGYF
jgi:hypothetical protein